MSGLFGCIISQNAGLCQFYRAQGLPAAETFHAAEAFHAAGRGGSAFDGPAGYQEPLCISEPVFTAGGRWMGKDFSCQTKSFFAAILTDCKGNRRGMTGKGPSDRVQRL